MDILAFATGVLTGAAAAIVIDKLIQKAKEQNEVKRSKILEECFGESMYTNMFSIAEARDWIKERENLLQNCTKAIIMNVTAETLKSIGKDLNIGTKMDKHIVIAIVDSENQNIVDSVLIKYERLDDKLIGALVKGDGVLVVEG